MQKEVIKLGKLFVKELKLERGSNTFSRWMAYYLAEKITAAEKANGDEKVKAEKECFEAILKLWEHRWMLPNERRPLRNFEPLLNLLQKLNPEKEDPYFYPEIPSLVKYGKSKKAKLGTTQFWVEAAQQIDRVARIWLADTFHLAAQAASDENTAEWLENAINIPDSRDTQIVKIILDKHPIDDLADIKENVYRDYDIEAAKFRIAELERYASLNASLLDYHKKELAKLKKAETDA